MKPKLVVRHDHEFDAQADAFFRQSSLAPVELEVHEPESQKAPPLSAGTRRAMHATVGILATSLVGLGSFLFYTHVLMPTPVELGVGGAVSAPMIIAPPSAAAQPSDVVMHHAQPVAAAPATLTVATPIAAAEPVVAQVNGARDAAPQAARETNTARPSAAAPSAEDALIKQAFRNLNGGRLETAIKQARRVLDSTPTRADAWLVLGSAYDGLHDHQSAKLAFRACSARAHGPYVSECNKLARD